MAGRAQAFSDPEVIRLLTSSFIPVAENASPLQRQQDAKGEFFRLVVEQGHYAGRVFPTETRQGYYAFTADGALLAARNSRDPREMEDLLRLALRRWELVRDVERLDVDVPDYTPAQASQYPEGGLVLAVATRDLPRADDRRRADWRKDAWNMDYAWFTAEEAASLVPTARAVGSSRRAPEEVVRRLARHHLRDFVRGEPPVWPSGAVKRAELTFTVLDAGRTAIGPVRLAISGTVRTEWTWSWFDRNADEARQSDAGMDLILTGEATWEPERGAFSAFDLAATGDRWGTSQYNSRQDDRDPAPVGIVFSLASDAPRDRTPPHTSRQPSYFASATRD